MSRTPASLIRTYRSQDRETVLALNQDSVQMLSPLDKTRIDELSDQCSGFWVAEYNNALCGFMLVFEQGSAYDSSNYQWFNQRYPRFAYVDRIVIDKGARGSGLGSAFYRLLEKHAREQGFSMLCAEVDMQPPNLPSLEFHRKLGFIEVGQRSYGEPSKTVSLLLRRL